MNYPFKILLKHLPYKSRETVNLQVLSCFSSTTTFTINKSTKTADLTPLTDIQQETRKKNPAGSHESCLHFSHHNTISSSAYSAQKPSSATYEVINFTCVPPSWFHMQIIPGLYILTPRRAPDPSLILLGPIENMQHRELSFTQKYFTWQMLLFSQISAHSGLTKSSTL